MKIKTGDTVKILLGKDNSKTGKVLKVLTKEGKILVEGINVYKRHVKKTAQSAGGVTDVTKPVNVSNLMLVCSKCKKPTRVGFRIEGKEKIRFCKKCKEAI